MGLVLGPLTYCTLPCPPARSHGDDGGAAKAILFSSDINSTPSRSFAAVTGAPPLPPATLPLLCVRYGEEGPVRIYSTLCVRRALDSPPAHSTRCNVAQPRLSLAHAMSTRRAHTTLH